MPIKKFYLSLETFYRTFIMNVGKFTMELRKFYPILSSMDIYKGLKKVKFVVLS